jgi:hypothetical protein
MQHLLEALEAHNFQSYAGRVTLFRARAQPLLCSFDPEMHWGELALGGVDVHVVPGVHHEICARTGGQAQVLPGPGTVSRKLSEPQS